jgi:hypothetical protein
LQARAIALAFSICFSVTGKGQPGGVSECDGARSCVLLCGVLLCIPGLSIPG